MPSLIVNSLASSLATSARISTSIVVRSTPPLRRRWKHGRGASYCGRLALRAAKSTRLCPRVGLWAGEEVVWVIVAELEAAVVESSSRWRLMDSCSSCNRRNRRSVRSRLWRGRLPRAEALEAARPGKRSVDMMAAALGVDMAGLWDGLPGPVVDW